MAPRQLLIEVKADRSVAGINRSWVRRIVARVLQWERAGRRRVSVLLTTDRKIRRVNRLHLGHDYATDVIAFWLPEDALAGEEARFLGDVVVSVETARRVAKRLRVPVRQELARYLAHGTLHLLGYTDKQPRARKRMCARQEKYLRRIFGGQYRETEP